ncbi:hypothetical protein quinque_013383 [Culex quinquefasciatus]
MNLFRKNVAARKNNGRPKPTPINQESFPALPNRNRVPNLEPIPLPGLRPKPAPNPVPPGFQRSDPTPGVKPNPPGDGPRPRTKLLTAAELLNTFKIMYAKLMQCQTVEEQKVDWSQVVRYLGLLIDSKLLFRYHLDDRIIKGIAMLKKLYPIINRRSKASLKNKLAVYKMVVAPMLLYGSPVWQGCAMTHRKKLQVIQNKFLRLILNQPWRTRSSDIHRLASIEPVDARLASLAEKHRNRALVSEHGSIRGLYP